jgi:hypothetical protein
LSIKLVDELIACHIEARGGLDKIMAILTIDQHGRVESPDMLVQIAGQRKRPNLLRIKFTIEEVTGQEGWDGTHAWEFNPWRGMSQAQYVTGAPAIALERGSEFDGPLINYREKGHTATYEGIEHIDGRPQHVVKVTRSDGNVVDHYIDLETMLVTRTRSVRHVHATDESMTLTVFDDYREVSGVLFSFRSHELAKDGQHNEHFVWEHIEANVPLEDDYFQLPQAAD